MHRHCEPKIRKLRFAMLFVLYLDFNIIRITPVSHLLNLNNEALNVSIIRVDGLDSIIIEG